MRSQHIWTSRDEDGRKREVRVTKFGGNWKFQSKYHDAAQWTYHDRPPTEDLRELVDVIFRKYQRRRASAEDFAAVEKMLKDQTRADEE
ncbi:MAG: hypothetical protein ACR2MW_10185 [Chthoniobacterales bacterium]